MATSRLQLGELEASDMQFLQDCQEELSAIRGNINFSSAGSIADGLEELSSLKARLWQRFDTIPRKRDHSDASDLAGAITNLMRSLENQPAYDPGRFPEYLDLVTPEITI